MLLCFASFARTCRLSDSSDSSEAAARTAVRAKSAKIAKAREAQQPQEWWFDAPRFAGAMPVSIIFAVLREARVVHRKTTLRTN
ncbi:hypothetical protein [Gemmatimonas sp.]|uniref:hypothetical protein n=1 Tax=Gemmatimonas sp. TaxID=1962908 RepID=UPI003563CE26